MMLFSLLKNKNTLIYGGAAIAGLFIAYKAFSGKSEPKKTAMNGVSKPSKKKPAANKSNTKKKTAKVSV